MGASKDTDEIILEKVPFWQMHIAQTMVPTACSLMRRIFNCVGGVQIRPADMVIADGDGIIVVPQETTEEVAHWAHEEHRHDRKKPARTIITRLGWSLMKCNTL